MIVMRHGQSEWNLRMTQTGRDPGIADPHLTGAGHAQAEAAVDRLAHLPIRRIITSPYRRALQTATPLARALGITIEVNLGVREHKAYSCDVGSPTSKIAAEWPHLDFAHVPEVWWPEHNETSPAVKQRAEAFQAQMRASADWDHTLVVSHWGFLMALTGESFENGEWRKLAVTP
jgi:broad specificity phosphatase PhoE